MERATGPCQWCRSFRRRCLCGYEGERLAKDGVFRKAVVRLRETKSGEWIEFPSEAFREGMREVFNHEGG